MSHLPQERKFGITEEEFSLKQHVASLLGQDFDLNIDKLKQKQQTLQEKFDQAEDDYRTKLTTQKKLDALKKLIEIIEQFNANKPTNPASDPFIDILFDEQNPVIAVRYIIPDVPQPDEGEVGAEVNHPITQVQLPLACSMELTYENGTVMTLHPNKKTEVNFPDGLKNEALEALVDQTVLYFIAQYKKPGVSVPSITYNLDKVKVEDRELKKHLVALTMQRVLATQVLDKDDQSKELTYAQKQELVLTGLRKGGMSLSKLSNIDENYMSLTSLFVAPAENFNNQPYLAKLYGKDNQVYIDNYLKGNDIKSTGYFDVSETGLRGIKHYLLGVGSRNKVDREASVHDALKALVETLGPDGKTSEENRKALYKQGVSDKQINKFVKDIQEKFNEAAKECFKDDSIVELLDDHDKKAPDLHKAFNEADLKRLKSFGFSESQLKDFLQHRLDEARASLDKLISSTIDPNAPELEVVLDVISDNEHFKKLQDFGLNVEKICEAYIERAPKVLKENEIFSKGLYQNTEKANPVMQRKILEAQVLMGQIKDPITEQTRQTKAYKELRALGLTDDNINQNVDFHKKTKAKLLDMVNEPDQQPQLPLQPQPEMEAREIEARVNKALELFSKIKPHVTSDMSFANRCKKDPNYQQLIKLGYEDADIDNMEAIRNLALNNAAIGSLGNPSGLKDSKDYKVLTERFKMDPREIERQVKERSEVFEKYIKDHRTIPKHYAVSQEQQELIKPASDQEIEIPRILGH